MRPLSPLVLVLLAAACTPSSGAKSTDSDPSGTGDPDTAGDTGEPIERGPNPHSLDAVLTWADLQVLGTHNSTHVEPDPVIHPSHAYTHPPLDEQLDRWGVRAFELDVHLHAELGWQVFHLPGVDAETTCLQLADCLTTMKRWSNQHPWHLPLMVWLEPKDTDLDGAFEELLYFEDRHDELEQAILDVLPRERIFTPDDLRGAHETLPAALAADGPPTLDRLRDRFIFSLLDSSEHRDATLAPSPVLENRVWFAQGSLDDPWGAVIKINDAAGSAADVQAAVLAGALVSSNVKDGPEHSEADAAAHMEASLAAGAQFLKVDRAAPLDGWTTEIPGGSPARCNPLTAPPECTPEELESL